MQRVWRGWIGGPHESQIAARHRGKILTLSATHPEWLDSNRTEKARHTALESEVHQEQRKVSKISSPRGRGCLGSLRIPFASLCSKNGEPLKDMMRARVSGIQNKQQ
jgi:hypothetical protein